jgi:hypothetical protein
MNEFSSPITFQGTALLLRRARVVSSVAQALLRWKTCMLRALEANRSAAKIAFIRSSAQSVNLVHCGMQFRRMRRLETQHAELETTRANIDCGAGKDCSGRRTMDLFTVVIIAAMLVTVATVFLGVLTMSVGGSTDKTLSTPLMWTRVGFQALTLVLLFAAIRLR